MEPSEKSISELKERPIETFSLNHGEQKQMGWGGRMRKEYQKY